MNTAHGKLAFQVQFWGLIGPLVALITLFVILIKSPSQAIYLSMATIIGLLASWKWKIQGAVLSFGSILVLYLYNFSDINPNEHLWHLGMNLSIVMGFVITALSLQEVESLLHPLEGNFESKDEISSEPQAVLEINELKKNIEEQELHLVSLKQEINQKTSQIISYEELVNTVKSESSKSNRQHEKLLEEFFEKQQLLSSAEEKLHEAKTQIQELLEKQLLLESKPKEGYPSNNAAFDHDAYEELKSTNEILSRERGRLESLLFRIQIDLHQKTQELATLPELQSELASLKQEKELLGQTLKEVEYREHELETKLYEKAKEIESIGNKQVVPDNSLVEELNEELQIAIQKREETVLRLETLEKQLISEQNRIKEEVESKQLLAEELQIAIQKREETVLRLETLEKQLISEQNRIKEEVESKLLLAEELQIAIEKREETVSRLETLEKQLISEQSRIKEKADYAEVLAEELKAASQKRDEVLRELTEIENRLTQEISQKSELENLLKQKNETESLNPNEISFDFKKIHGKYNQLREQFEEKSHVLHETRKELFKKEESLLQLQLEQDEKEKYYFSDTERHMQSYLLNVIEESDQLRKEIKELNDIISKLLTN